MTGVKVPKYRDLPIKQGAPKGSAWGVFDKDSKRDVYGTLNFITPEAILAAKEEIRAGESVVLNLPLHLPYHSSNIGRCEFSHKFLADAFEQKCVDDEITINTQATSQWDGLLHFANQDLSVYYNGVPYEAASIHRSDKSLGIQSLSQRGGIVARGILVDFVRYAARKGIEYNPLGPYRITLDQIQEILQEEKVETRQGDILVVRCGLSKYIRASTPEDPTPFTAGGNQTHVGIDPTPELIEWLWDSNFAAVAGDSLACEAVPAFDGSFGRLHTACLPGWGMPLGELLDLEALAALAEKHQRWTFFMTVSPLNIDGGAATLSNTIAIM
ncbi:hypothetical protein A1O3_06992 [Capronia epimyces CBS 606.96]|uniref:Cyclase n=1 Tax=Capronia epimyces CBS 606.96 TaxID=1182542 RepID=W9XKF7_9EURO|nr:uncharacterized protein A1O3_06992 [Capronia epimyces CBS 606.96]EXJ80708.1 hypothetical protein A1O3_06992 [Capronia epimyces CBS 606.96]